MFLSRWFRTRPTSKLVRTKASFRPELFMLEDRLVPSGSGHDLLTGHGMIGRDAGPSCPAQVTNPNRGPGDVKAAAVVTHFAVFVEDNAQVGVPTKIKVLALDANNQVVKGYTGTVHFTSSDTGALLPADYTFVAGDQGKHEFMGTFSMTGPQTVTVTDTSSKSVMGQGTVQVGAEAQPDDLDAACDNHGAQGHHA